MIGFHTSEIQLWRAVSYGEKPLNRQIMAISEKFRASSSEAWTTWTMGAGASLTIWVGAFPPKADRVEPAAIFAKLGAIWSRRYKTVKDQKIRRLQKLEDPKERSDDPKTA